MNDTRMVKATKTVIEATSSQNRKGGNAETAGVCKAPKSVCAGTEVSKGNMLNVFGSNLCGQLGFECERRMYPTILPALETKQFVAVAAGSMHTLALDDNGKVWSFGNNDEMALGRNTNEDYEGFPPETVDVPGKVIGISAGDSHSAALTEGGDVYIWGVFRDEKGKFGLIADDGPLCRAQPVKITGVHVAVKIAKISSGMNHLAMLGANGKVYTCGAGSQGQLGRLNPNRGPMKYTRNTSFYIENGLAEERLKRLYKHFCLQPAPVKIGSRTKIGNIWCGEYNTFMLSTNGNHLYVTGLNNYGQLGIRKTTRHSQSIITTPTKATSFRGIHLTKIASGVHHTVVLDNEGLVYTLGRNAYGLLGLGPEVAGVDIINEPQIVEELAGARAIDISAGSLTSYAIIEGGILYSWGFGRYYQLASGDDTDKNLPWRCVGNRVDDPNGGYIYSDIEGNVVNVDGGGQHVVLLISEDN